MMFYLLDGKLAKNLYFYRIIAFPYIFTECYVCENYLSFDFIALIYSFPLLYIINYVHCIVTCNYTNCLLYIFR